ncbi:adenylyl-sulfate kinase [Helicobacter pullorum]|uniref:adenylyl-sulfate kinase n=1 Tax=Helicobacter pullorum TaxID=35818 RepID=UPI000816AE38|nr:adenylyl-sulfate kinase [Helicobacter pullorum]OCR15003.1 adenylyl-sulfate kinase [Helicobacter pullorum]
MENVVWQEISISKTQRASIKGQKPCVLWFTGLSGSGKSTLANEIEKELFKRGFHTYLLDGDNVRHGLNKDLGFDRVSREENIRRIAEVCKLFVDSGLIVLSAFVSPFIQDRQNVRNLLWQGEFIEIFMDTPLEVCEKRDIKGLYKKARNGEIKDFTGISSPYEKPLNAEIHIKDSNFEKNVELILKYLEKGGFLSA